MTYDNKIETLRNHCINLQQASFSSKLTYREILDRVSSLIAALCLAHSEITKLALRAVVLEKYTKDLSVGFGIDEANSYLLNHGGEIVDFSRLSIHMIRLYKIGFAYASLMNAVAIETHYLHPDVANPYLSVSVGKPYHSFKAFLKLMKGDSIHETTLLTISRNYEIFVSFFTLALVDIDHLV